MKNRRRLTTTLVVTLVATVALLLWVTGVFGLVGKGFTPKLGLDLAGGTSVVLSAPADTRKSRLDKAVDIIRSRTDGLGVAEPEIAVEGDRNIVVQLPGLKDESRALKVIGTTAELSFRPVLGMQMSPEAMKKAQKKAEQEAKKKEKKGKGDEKGGESTTTAPGTPTTEPGATTTAPGATTTGPGSTTSKPQALGSSPTWRAASLSSQATPPTTTPLPAPPPTEPGGVTTLPGDGSQPITPVPSGDVEVTPPGKIRPTENITVPSKDGELLYQLGPEVVAGREVKSASAQIQQGGLTNQWIVSLKFSSKGDEAYEKATAKACESPENDPKRQIAIVLDGKVESAPQVAPDACPQGISGGGIITLGQATGKKQEAEAKDLALVLNYGSLPVRLSIANVDTISPTLGRDSLRAGLLAAAIGLALVAVFVILVYRLLGLLIVFRLVVFGVLTYVFVAVMSEFRGLTLSLSGLAAIAVSVGINADSAIVALERVKDEMREGRTTRTSFERGFKRAWTTIINGDVVSLLAALILYALAVGSVRGFALMLGIATLLDIFISWTVTRPFALLLGNTKLFDRRALAFWRMPAGKEALT